MKEQKQDPSKLVVFTLGTSNRSREEFLEIIKKHNIKQVIDVRSFPKSKRFPHFDRENLAKLLTSAGIHYHWLGKELGGFRKGGYEKYMDTKEFEKGIKRLLQLIAQEKSVIVCAEKFPWKCHRRFISQKLASMGVEVRHIIEKNRLWAPGKLLIKI